MTNSILDHIWGNYVSFLQQNPGRKPSLFIVHPILFQEARKAFIKEPLNNVVVPEPSSPLGVSFLGVKVIRSLDIKTEEILCM